MKKTILGLILWGGILSLVSCVPGKTSSGLAPVNPVDFNIYLNQGIESLGEKDYTKAAFYLKQAVAADPRSGRAYNLLGVAFFQQKNYLQAKSSFEKAVSLKADYAAAYNNLGSAFCLLKDLEKAKVMFLKAVSLSPKAVSSIYSLGTILLMMGNAREGMAYLAKGIELDPDFLEKHQDMITGLSYQGYDEAEMAFSYARLFASAGNIDKTLFYLEKADRARFKDWARVLTEKEFDKIKDDPKIREFLKAHRGEE
jgi:Tfp pilus assembly protein PilF